MRRRSKPHALDEDAALRDYMYETLEDPQLVADIIGRIMRPDIFRGWSGDHAKRVRTTCMQGHPMTPDNVYIYPNGKWSRCCICAKEKNRAYAAKMKQQRAKAAGA